MEHAIRRRPDAQGRDPAAAWLVLSAWVACAGAWSGCTDGGTGERQLLGALTITGFQDGQVLTRLRDVDAATPGLQVHVDVGAVDVAPGTVVTLEVDTVPGMPRSTPLQNGVATFTVTLPVTPGTPGTLHRMSASAAGAVGASVSVRTVDDVQPACVIVDVADGAVLRQPAADEGGVLRDIRVDCEGGTPTTTGEVTLQVLGGAAQDRPVLEPVAMMDGTGQATFLSVLLPEGRLRLRVLRRGADGSPQALHAISVEVDTGRCDAWPAVDAPTGVLNAHNTTDARPITPVLDAVVGVVSMRCPSSTAEVRVDGRTVVEGALSSGAAGLVVPLPEGARQLQVRVRGSTVRADGASPPWLVVVDRAVACPAWVAPSPAAEVGPWLDEEMPPQADNGVTTTVRGRVTGPREPGMRVQLRARGPMGTARETVLGTVDDDGAFAWTLPDLGVGTWTVDAVVADGAGNRCPAAGRPPVTRSFSVVDAEGPALRAVLEGDSVRVDGILALAEDADPAEPGLQAAITVTGRDTLPTGTRTWVRLLSLDAQGNEGASTQAFADVDATGVARVLVGVPGEELRVDAWTAPAEGTGGVRVDNVLRFRADARAPAVMFLHPEDRMELGAGTVDVQLLVTDADADRAAARVLVGGAVHAGSAAPGPDGVITFRGVALRGSADGQYRLTAEVPDAAGNTGRATVDVRVVLRAPVPTLVGVDADGSPRALVPAADEGSPVVNVLDIRMNDALALLDYNANRDDGLQYGFAVEVPIADCMNLDQPQAVVRVSGVADDLRADLLPAGAVCRGTVGMPGLGVTLPDGEGSALAFVRDAAGNIGARRYLLDVRRKDRFVRVDAPVNGARVGAAMIPVTASTDLPGPGTCVLEQDGMATGEPVMLEASMMLGPATPPAVDGASSALVVACTVDGVVQRSLPVNVQRDDAGPANARLVLGGGAAVPPVFNAAVPTDGPAAHPRFLKDVAVEVDAEVGGCSRLVVASLVVEGVLAEPVTYAPRVTAAGTWVFIPGTPVARCRTVFPQVDLGATREPGRTVSLSATATDSAGNTTAAPVLQRLVDRVPPALVRLVPTVPAVRAEDDAHPGTPGVQVPVVVEVQPDGRELRVSLSCTGPLSCAPTELVLAGSDMVAAFDDAALAPTFAVVDADGVGTWSARAVDAAQNTTVLPGAAWLMTRTPQVLLPLAMELPVLNLSSDNAAMAGWQGGLQVTVTACGAAGVPGTVDVEFAGARVGTAPVEADGAVVVPVSMPDARDAALVATCTTPRAEPATDTRILTVDTVPPRAPLLLATVAPGRPGSLVARWNAPGDDGDDLPLQAGAYRLALATQEPLTPATFDAAEPVDAAPAMPRAPGTEETISAELGLVTSPFLLALAVTDAAGNTVIAHSMALSTSWQPLQTTITVPANAVLSARTGRINGDAHQDLVLGTTDGVRVLYGTGGALPVPDAFPNVFLPAGDPGDGCGQGAEVLPDLDGDGVDEVWVSCASTTDHAYLWWGRGPALGTGTPPDLVITRARSAAQRPASGDGLGRAVLVTDVDGDMAMDLVLSVPRVENGGSSPETWVVHGDGTRAGWSTSAGELDLPLALANGRAARVTGDDGAGAGTRMAAVNATTGARLVLGAPGQDGGAGAAWVLAAGQPVRGFDGTLMAMEAEGHAWKHAGMDGADALGADVVDMGGAVALLAGGGTELVSLEVDDTGPPRAFSREPLQGTGTALRAGLLLRPDAATVVVMGSAGVELLAPGRAFTVPNGVAGMQATVGDLTGDGRDDLVVLTPGQPLVVWP